MRSLWSVYEISAVSLGSTYHRATRNFLQMFYQHLHFNFVSLRQSLVVAVQRTVG